MKAHIIGTGSYLPPDILTNDDLAKLVDTSDEWIVSRTGIRERHIAAPELSNAEMGCFAARAALADAGVGPEEVDLLIVSTATQDRPFPSTACDLQYRLGAENAFCFDISAACTGFVYALDIADRYIQTGGAKTALVVAAEQLSRTTDMTDRTTCVLFGDGAGAVVLRAREESGGILASCLASRGDFGEAIHSDDDRKIRMKGQEVYKFAVRAMPEAMERVLRKTGKTPDELTFVIPHQANVRIIESVRDKYDIAPEKMVITIGRTGNTSSASIPIALDELNRAGRLAPGALLMLVGFGAGLTYGATLYEWSVREG